MNRPQRGKCYRIILLTDEAGSFYIKCVNLGYNGIFSYAEAEEFLSNCVTGYKFYDGSLPDKWPFWLLEDDGRMKNRNNYKRYEFEIEEIV